MERMTSQSATSPSNVLSPAPHFRQGKPQNSPCQLDVSGAVSKDYTSLTTVGGGAQYTPEMEFPTNPWPMDSPMGYLYTGGCNGYQIEEAGNAALEVGSMDQVHSQPRVWSVGMSTDQVSDSGIGPLTSDYDLIPGERGVPRISMDQTEEVQPSMEEVCHSTDQTPMSSEVMFALTTANCNPAQNVDLLQGSQAAKRQFLYVGSGLKPHARPSGLGNEYVSYTGDHAKDTNSKLLPDHQAKAFNNNLAYRPKPNDGIFDTREFLCPTNTYLGRRRSVPRRRLKKLSSMDQRIDHTQLVQERIQMAGTQVFDANMRVKPGRRKRRFSDGEKEHIRRVRKIGACPECRLKKRKVCLSETDPRIYWQAYSWT